MNKKHDFSFNRRHFLKTGITGLAALGFGLTAEARLKKIPVGLQLYSVREQCKTDLPGVIAAVAKMGYAGVEFAGYYGFTAPQLRKMLDDNGLVCCGTHTPLESVNLDTLQATIDFNKTLGNPYLIVPWMKADSKQGWMDKAKQFNDLAERCAAQNMRIGYHAHAHDFQKFEGEAAWDIFFGNTRKDVIMQLDTSNCRKGGADPVEVLKQYKGRGTTIHLKSNGESPEAVIGEDDIQWKEVFKLCEKNGTRWYVVEHETSKDPLNAVKRCREALKKMGR